MKKLISGILSAAMVAGMALVGAGAADENNKALKFDDTVLSEGGAANGYMSLDTGDKDNSLFSEGGMTLEFDFTMGHTAPCIHPFDATLYHTPKLNITIGSNGDGEFKCEDPAFEGKLSFSVEKADGAKCERCWCYSETVGEDHDHPTLCKRCVEQVTKA